MSFAEGTGRPIEARARRLDGTPLDAELLTRRRTPVELGEVRDVIAVRDITERKQSDAALLRAQRLESVGRLAADGAAALALLENERVDLVVTDMVMEGMTGAELAASVHERWQLPCVLMSGYTGENAPDAPQITLRKPFVPRELRVAVAREIGEEPPGASVAVRPGPARACARDVAPRRGRPRS